jgi:hypothetical protein
MMASQPVRLRQAMTSVVGSQATLSIAAVLHKCGPLGLITRIAFGEVAGAPAEQRRPWWGGDRLASMRRLPSDTATPAAGSGQLGLSRSERPAAERAGALCLGTCPAVRLRPVLVSVHARVKHRYVSEGRRCN